VLRADWVYRLKAVVSPSHFFSFSPLSYSFSPSFPILLLLLLFFSRSTFVLLLVGPSLLLFLFPLLLLHPSLSRLLVLLVQLSASFFFCLSYFSFFVFFLKWNDICSV